MMMNKQTYGFQVLDMGYKITSSDEAYACTNLVRKFGPVLRSILSIQKVQNVGDDLVRYGEHVRFVTNPYIFSKPLFLMYSQCTP